MMLEAGMRADEQNLILGRRNPDPHAVELNCLCPEDNLIFIQQLRPYPAVSHPIPGQFRVQVYLGVIQNRNIELDGFRWPIDTLIIATSNNSEFNKFIAAKEEAPMVDRCRTCYVAHNTDYKLQEQLTTYAIGSEVKTTLTKERLHQEFNQRAVNTNSPRNLPGTPENGT
jgi:hypothetical protein